jgi:hypothetical protein
MALVQSVTETMTPICRFRETESKVLLPRKGNKYTYVTSAQAVHAKKKSYHNILLQTNTLTLQTHKQFTPKKKSYHNMHLQTNTLTLQAHKQFTSKKIIPQHAPSNKTHPLW